MINTFSMLYHNPAKLLEYVLENYFRKSDAAGQEARIMQLLKQTSEVRWHVARIYHDPQLIEILIDDPSPMVRKAAMDNPYWLILGQFKPLLSLPEVEKIQYIGREGFSSILVFLVYETNLKVLKSAFLNPTVSIAMLEMMRRYLIRRGTRSIDNDILRLIQQSIKLKQHYLRQISAINRAKDNQDVAHCIANLTPFLLDEDMVIVQTAVSHLERYPYSEIAAALISPTILQYISVHQLWCVLDAVRRHFCYVKDDFKPERLVEMNGFPPVDPLKTLVQSRKLELLELCQSDLNNPHYFFTVVQAHTDEDKQVRKMVTDIINVDELISLITDNSFPVLRAMKSLNILSQHPFPSIRKRLESATVQLALRSQKRLEEMETTINACLDIVFDFGKVVLSGKIQNDVNTLKELNYIYELLVMIVNFPGETVKNENFAKAEDPQLYREQHHKVHSLWKATIGQYLGRLKELEEVIRDKWVVPLITGGKHRSREYQEFSRTLRQLEWDYKKAVGCELAIACRKCQNRACASERFLVQIEYLIGEIIDKLSEKPELPQTEVAKENLSAAPEPY